MCVYFIACFALHPNNYTPFRLYLLSFRPQRRNPSNYFRTTLKSTYSGACVILALKPTHGRNSPRLFRISNFTMCLLITSFDNGILEWEGASDTQWTVDVREPNVTGVGARFTVQSPSFDTNIRSLRFKPLEIIITGENGKSMAVRVDPEHTALSLRPVKCYTVENGVLHWQPEAGASGYRVVDIERNVTHVTDTEYDMTESLIVYGVYPVSASELISDAQDERVDIPYLSGTGTRSDPYMIETPFDLRAIDYYETLYAEDKKTGTPDRNRYKIACDIDFDIVDVSEEESNIYPLGKPFFGELDGNDRTLSHIRVRASSGPWALFELIANGGTVKNLRLDAPEIVNSVKHGTLPINASIAAIVYENYGTVECVTVRDALFTATGGEIGGICIHNYKSGRVLNCKVRGTFRQKATGVRGQACYEMAGVTLENYGFTSGNFVSYLTVEGSPAVGGDCSVYNCVRCCGGIVAVNRASGRATDNSFRGVAVGTALDADGGEFGGIVAYNAGLVSLGSGTLGVFRHNGIAVTAECGEMGKYLGRLVGKNDGTAF